jgi:hypothetical protein
MRGVEISMTTFLAAGEENGYCTRAWSMFGI